MEKRKGYTVYEGTDFRICLEAEFTAVGKPYTVWGRHFVKDENRIIWEKEKHHEGRM